MNDPSVLSAPFVESPMAPGPPAARETRDEGAAQHAAAASAAPLRIWLLTNVPSPYQVELLAAVASRPEMKLQVRLMRDESAAGSSAATGFPGRVLWGLAPRSWRDELRLHPQAVWECLVGRYDGFVLSGLMNSVTFFACMTALRLRGAPWAVWLERPRPAGSSWRARWLTRGPVRWLRNWHVGQVLASARRVIGIGRAATDEYALHGVPAERLGVLPYCCDIGRFAPAATPVREEIRRRLGLAGQVVFLYSGQLIERKGVDTLLRAFQQIAADRPDWTLLLLGDGPMRQTLQSLVPPELAGRVRFPGHVPQGDLPDAFRAADVFVFPSRHDGWGVVLNEACGAGLPIIATRQTGAARELVVDGVNGFQVECDDVETLAGRMRELGSDPDLRRTCGAESRRLVERLSVANGSRMFLNEMQALLGTGTVRRPTAEGAAPR